MKSAKLDYKDWEIKKVSIKDKDYPGILKKIKDPPKKLYYRGNLKSTLLNKTLAIVGSRKMTRYGSDVIEKFIPDLVSEGVTTISGFMYGVDTAVHQKTVDYGGKTVAVFGCGLNVIYPSENDQLYGQILQREGVVISEYEPNAKPHLWKFPQRNRIVAGLSNIGVLVVEGGQKSGSLLTARLAGKQGKKVFAIPGPITSSVSAGPNRLIKNSKANLVLTAGDILGKRVQKSGQSNLPLEITGLQRKIYEHLKTEPLSVDEIIRLTGETVNVVGQEITTMSLKGIITETGGKYYLSIN